MIVWFLAKLVIASILSHIFSNFLAFADESSQKKGHINKKPREGLSAKLKILLVSNKLLFHFHNLFEEGLKLRIV